MNCHACMRLTGQFLLLPALLLLLLSPGPASGHVFLHHSAPAAGSSQSASPDRVSLWFDGDLEAAFCRITVKDKSEGQVDKGDSGVDAADPALLKVSLPRLKTGTYRVDWNVVGRDGHRSQGDFEFSVQ